MKIILFKILGRVPIHLSIGDRAETDWVEKWFDCQYNTKTKQAHYLRAGGVLGKEIELADSTRALITQK